MKEEETIRITAEVEAVRILVQEEMVFVISKTENYKTKKRLGCS